jgi:hypothetical protein
MTRYLYTIEPIPERPDIVWVSLPMTIENWPQTLLGRRVSGEGVTCITLDGEAAPRHHGAITVLSPVGSHDDSKGLLNLITPLLVEMAREKVKEKFLFCSAPREQQIGRLLERIPYETSIWILRATPEELQSWAETIGRRS